MLENLNFESLKVSSMSNWVQFQPVKSTRCHPTWAHLSATTQGFFFILSHRRPPELPSPPAAARVGRQPLRTEEEALDEPPSVAHHSARGRGGRRGRVGRGAVGLEAHAMGRRGCAGGLEGHRRLAMCWWTGVSCDATARGQAAQELPARRSNPYSPVVAQTGCLVRVSLLAAIVVVPSEWRGK